VFDETTGLSDIEINDCNNGEAVVESENGGLEQRLSSGAGASGDCMSQVHRGKRAGFDGCECLIWPTNKSILKLAFDSAKQVEAMGTGDKRVIGLHIAVEE
jgi:hypothetical protein